tara:strand:- start:1939 stop:2649 length:711 start_codon:yes stop_codon:yes gene_type:complete
VKDTLQILPVLELARDVPGVTGLACHSRGWAVAQNAVLPALSEPEARRVAKLKNPEARERLLVSLASARQMLGSLLDIRPSDVDLQRNAQGAPFLESHPEQYLSISRSDDWTAVALGDARPMGLDIERLRSIDWQPMLGMVCSDDERAALVALADATPDSGLAAFFALWTIKEAVLKAVGKGLRGGAKGVPVQMGSLGCSGGSEQHVIFEQAEFVVHTEWHDELIVSLAVAANGGG